MVIGVVISALIYLLHLTILQCCIWPPGHGHCNQPPDPGTSCTRPPSLPACRGPLLLDQAACLTDPSQMHTASIFVHMLKEIHDLQLYFGCKLYTFQIQVCDVSWRR